MSATLVSYSRLITTLSRTISHGIKPNIFSIKPRNSSTILIKKLTGGKKFTKLLETNIIKGETPRAVSFE